LWLFSKGFQKLRFLQREWSHPIPNPEEDGDRQILTPWLIHGGTARLDREKTTVLPWNDIAPLLGKIA